MTALDPQFPLRPLTAATGVSVREHEVLRIAATVQGKNTATAADGARRQILAWAQNRCGGRLPKEAWQCENFEYLAGGRNLLAVRLRTDNADIWAIRADDPDKAVPGRIWTTEVIVGGFLGQTPHLSVRQIVNTTESHLQIEPHTPGFVRQVIEICGLSVGRDGLDDMPLQLVCIEEAEELLERLLDPARTLPFILLSGDERSEVPDKPMLNAEMLARSVIGLAHVTVVPAHLTRLITDRLGSTRSVFHGGVRYYHPGLSATSDPFQHRLFTANQISEPSQKERAVRWLRTMAAEYSLRRNRLGREVPTFGDIRNASLRAQQERLVSDGASEGEQLVAAKSSIVALEKQLSDAVALQDFFADEAERDKSRAESAEVQLRAATYYIQQLHIRLEANGVVAIDTATPPEDFDELASWCDLHFAGRLALTSVARRGMKDADFEDVTLAARCIEWLATTYRNGRINGAEGDFRDFLVEGGVRNAPCGGDEFEVEWQGRRHTADWHLKNGGNTRDPRRCLRIYYFWEAETQQVIVADMPQHRRTSAT